MNKQQKEQAKEFIEDTLNDYISAKLGATDPLYSFFKATGRSINGRTAYDMIKRFENGQDICKDYDFGKDKSLREGIPLSLIKINKDIWVPQQYIKHNDNLKKRKDIDSFFTSFEVFETDEYNAFCDTYTNSNLSEDNPLLIRRILSCKDENKKIIGDKLNLFLENPAWRKDAKKYTQLLVNSIHSFYNKLPELKDYSYIDTTSKRAKQGLKAIDLITSLYLDEIK